MKYIFVVGPPDSPDNEEVIDLLEHLLDVLDIPFQMLGPYKSTFGEVGDLLEELE